jgi:hypothetical protein
MSITREELLRAVEEAGLVIKRQKAWSRCMGPKHLLDTHRRLYIAHACNADGLPKVDLSRFSLRHPAVLQRDPEEAEDHKGRVMGALDFGLPDHQVWDAFRQAIRAIREQPRLFSDLLLDAP